MKKFFLLAIAALPSILFAQEKSQDKEAERIIITKKGGSEGKMNIVVDGDKVTVNGQPVGDNDDAHISVKRMKIKDMDNFSWEPNNGFGRELGAYGRSFPAASPNKAMLGVTTDKADDGVRIVSITNESAAEKAGLKEGDIITSVDGKNIETPDALSQSLKDKKPGDKVTIAYVRDGNKQNVTAELTKWKAPPSWTLGEKGGGSWQIAPFNNNMEDLMGKLPPEWGGTQNYPQFRAYSMPGMNGGFSNGAKLGIRIQDDENNSGVKVLDVQKGSDADKAGLKEDDIIKDVNGIKISGTDNIIDEVKHAKSGDVLRFKIERKGKMQDINVKLSKKTKTANL